MSTADCDCEVKAQESDNVARAVELLKQALALLTETPVPPPTPIVPYDPSTINRCG